MKHKAFWVLVFSAFAFGQATPSGCEGEDHCCSPTNLCSENEGDCDTDADCQGSLVCGQNNCPGGGNFDENDDCCKSGPVLSDTISVGGTGDTGGECAQGSTSMENVMEIPTLGRPVMLGELYSMYKDQFMPGFSLWDFNAINETKTTILIPSADNNFEHGETFDNTLNLLDVSASLKATFQAGMVKLSGSAKVLQQETDYENKAHVRLSYLSTTRAESLGQDLTCKAAPLCERFDEKQNENSPTHVVSQIIYGGNAHFVFEKEVSMDEDVLEIEAKLAVTVTLAFMEITGSGAVNYKDNSVNNDTSIKIKMFSDFIIKKQPLSVMEALDEYQRISSHLGSIEDDYQYSVPMTAVLIPISQYCLKAPKSTEENIGEALIEEAVMKYTMLKQTDKTIEKLLKTYAATYNLQIRVLLNGFRQEVSKKVNSYSLELVKLIPRVKHGNESSLEDMNKLIRNYTDSCFNLDNSSMFTYVEKRKREVAAIDKFYQQTIRKRPGQNVPIIAQFQRAQIPIALIDRKLVFILDMCIIPKNVAFDPENCAENEKEENNWYDVRTTVGNVGKMWRNYLAFVNANLNITGPGNVSTYFVDIHDTDYSVCASKVANLSLYEDGERLGEPGEEFKVPDEITEEPLVCREEKGKLIIHVRNPETPQGGISSITKVRFNYTNDDNNPDFLGWKIEESIIGSGEYTKVTIEGIDSELSYKFNVSHVTKYGVGPPSQVFYSKGPLSDMAQLPGCVISTNRKYTKYKLVGHELSVTQCADQSLYLATTSDSKEYYKNKTTPNVAKPDINETVSSTPVGLFYWTYDFSSRNCYIISEMPGTAESPAEEKDYALPSKGWALGSPSCGSDSQEWKKVNYGLDCTDGNGATVIDEIEYDGEDIKWLPNCKLACYDKIDCQGLSLAKGQGAKANGTCSLLKKIDLSQCTYNKDYKLFTSKDADIPDAWGGWNSWSSCNPENKQTRRRWCRHDGCGLPCPGEATDSRDCVPDCPMPWAPLSTGCYLFGQGTDLPEGQTMTWLNAKQFCNDKQAELIVVENDAENDAVVEEMKNIKIGLAWIGLTGSVGEGWRWNSTGEVANYTNWASGEPNGDGHCVHYEWVKKDFLWNDLSCGMVGDGMGCICEKNPDTGSGGLRLAAIPATPAPTTVAPTTVAPTTVAPPCDGGDNCCTSSNQCGVGEGDCDDDNDCKEDLVCGQNNCQTGMGGNFEGDDDCCENPT